MLVPWQEDQVAGDDACLSIYMSPPVFVHVCMKFQYPKKKILFSKVVRFCIKLRKVNIGVKEKSASGKVHSHAKYLR